MMKCSVRPAHCSPGSGSRCLAWLRAAKRQSSATAARPPGRPGHLPTTQRSIGARTPKLRRPFGSSGWGLSAPRKPAEAASEAGLVHLGDLPLAGPALDRREPVGLCLLSQLRVLLLQLLGEPPEPPVAQPPAGPAGDHVDGP